MKLLDLLKSLNSGPALNPDTAAALTPDTGATTDNRQRLLTELTSIAELLDAPASTDTKQSIPAATPPTANLLDLEHIFGEDDAFDTADDFTLADAQAMPLLFMPAEAADEPLSTPPPISKHQATNSRQQIIESLLNELLPTFEAALAQRLNQLDNATLQQWQQALEETTELQNTAHK